MPVAFVFVFLTFEASCAFLSWFYDFAKISGTERSGIFHDIQNTDSPPFFIAFVSFCNLFGGRMIENCIRLQIFGILWVETKMRIAQFVLQKIKNDLKMKNNMGYMQFSILLRLYGALWWTKCDQQSKLFFSNFSWTVIDMCIK